jgi:tetratricopeptide (TPR) repeat protein
LFLFLAVPIALLLIRLGLFYVRAWHDYDSVANRALAKANEGDAEGAMADLQALIQSKGMTAPRANALGCVHYARKEWNEAERMFDEAVRLGTGHEHYTMNHALARFRTGHHDEALALLQEFLTRYPNHIFLACNFCELLIELGRMEEARGLYAQMEDRRKNTTYLGAASRESVERRVTECRAKLEGKPKTDLSALDDL